MDEQQTTEIEQTDETQQMKRDPNAPKRKYELKHITREQRLAICRKGAVARAMAVKRIEEVASIRKLARGCVIKVSGETKHDIELLAVEMNLSYGEVVQMAIENFKEALGK